MIGSDMETITRSVLLIAGSVILEYLIAPPGSDAEIDQSEALSLIQTAVENGNFTLVVVYPNGTEYPITPHPTSFKSWDVDYTEPDCE